VLHLDDLNDLRSPGYTPSAMPTTSESTTSDGWTGLMQLAADFPLELLSFGAAVDLAGVDAPTVVLPRPRSFSSELSSQRLDTLVDSAGDGPLIGLGAGMSLAGH
jgi:hypothetical protein